MNGNGQESSTDDLAGIRERYAKYQSYLKLDTENIKLISDLFDLSLQLAELEHTQTYLQSLIRLAPFALSTLHRKASLAMRMQNYELAAQELSTLVQLEPEAGALWHDLAYCHLMSKNYPACGEVLNQVDQMRLLDTVDEQCRAALQVLSLRYMHLTQKHSQAIAAAIKWQESGTLSARAAGVASLIAFDNEELQLASQWAKLGQQQLPPEDEAIMTEASLALMRQDTEYADACLSVLLNNRPHDGRVASMAGISAMYQRNLPKAQHYLQQATAWMSQHIGSWLALGWVCYGQTDLRGAEQAFDQALALDRNFAESHGALAVIYASSARVEQAQVEIKLALGLEATNAAAQYAKLILSGQAQNQELISAIVERTLQKLTLRK